jgi:hypothetical protein
LAPGIVLPTPHIVLRMRAYAYAEGRPLAEIARDVVTRTLRFDEDQP